MASSPNHPGTGSWGWLPVLRLGTALAPSLCPPLCFGREASTPASCTLSLVIVFGAHVPALPHQFITRRLSTHRTLRPRPSSFWMPTPLPSAFSAPWSATHGSAGAAPNAPSKPHVAAAAQAAAVGKPYGAGSAPGSAGVRRAAAGSALAQRERQREGVGEAWRVDGLRSWGRLSWGR